MFVSKRDDVHNQDEKNVTVKEKMRAYQLVDDLSSTTLCQAATKASLFFVKLIDMFLN